MEKPNNPYPEIPNSSKPYEPPNTYQQNEQESHPPYVYTQPNQPNYQVPPSQQYGPQRTYAMGQPAYMPGGGGNTFGQPLVLSNKEKWKEEYKFKYQYMCHLK